MGGGDLAPGAGGGIAKGRMAGVGCLGRTGEATSGMGWRRTGQGEMGKGR